MRILLIGDSICNGYSAGPGYHPFVAEALNASDTHVGAQACSDSGDLLARLPTLLGDAAWDVIHFNCGLHDLRRDRPTAALRTEPAAYVGNVESIVGTLQRTGARLIWATITPVNDERHARAKPFDRRESDVLRYNALAREAMARAGVAVDDLHTVVTTLGVDALQHADGVHYTLDGSRALASAVAESIRVALAGQSSAKSGPSQRGRSDRMVTRST